MEITSITFNPFQQNMTVAWDDSGECVIVDPSNHNTSEDQALAAFIEEKNLKPVRLLNTHAHLDHILGNAYVANKWGLAVEMHEKDLPTFALAEASSHLYGIPYTPSPEPSVFLEEGDQVKFGNTVLDVIFCPGHAPGHIAFISHPDKVVIGGDVLFQMSIGRTDLPGGDFPTLEKSIREKFYTLPDDYTVLPGHGPQTTIGFEKSNNQFVRAI